MFLRLSGLLQLVTFWMFHLDNSFDAYVVATVDTCLVNCPVHLSIYFLQPGAWSLFLFTEITGRRKLPDIPHEGLVVPVDGTSAVRMSRTPDF